LFLIDYSSRFESDELLITKPVSSAKGEVRKCCIRNNIDVDKEKKRPV